jgi:hypothetical protein
MENTWKTDFQGNMETIQKLITEIDRKLSRPMSVTLDDLGNDVAKLRADTRELKRRFDTVSITLAAAVTALISGFIVFIFVSL